MASFIKYDSTIGNIISIINCPENMIEIQINENEDYIQGIADDTSQYINVNSKTIENKLQLDMITLSNTNCMVGDNATISNIPESTVFRITAGENIIEGICDDDSLEIELTSAGEYTVILTHPHYFDKEVILNAN